MADFKTVYIQEVHSENLEKVWPAVTGAIENCEFIALDLELSGLGNKRKLMSHMVEDRYANLLDVVRTRAVISVGLSCFRRMDPTASGLCQKWVPQTFDVSVLCDEEYIVEPGSLKFLTEHGFDFNSQYAKGLPFKRGNDRGNEPPMSIRSLIGRVLSCGRPLVMHNALVDLTFLYGSFYATLPSSFGKFLADLSVIFATGLYDTKCLAEYCMRLPASYLSYLFRYSQRRNYKEYLADRPHISLLFVTNPSSSDVSVVKCKMRSSFTTACAEKAAVTAPSQTVCQLYASHGFCQLRHQCPNTHDIDDVLDREDAEQAKKCLKRKRRTARKAGENGTRDDLSDGEISSSSDDENAVEPEAKKACSTASGEASLETKDSKKNGASESPVQPSQLTADVSSKPQRKWCYGSHRAGFDAFMTGFFFASCLQRCSVTGASSLGEAGGTALSGVVEYENKVALSGKPQPLQLVKSHYATNSPQHVAKWAKLTQGV